MVAVRVKLTVILRQAPATVQDRQVAVYLKNDATLASADCALAEGKLAAAACWADSDKEEVYGRQRAVKKRQHTETAAKASWVCVDESRNPVVGTP